MVSNGLVVSMLSDIVTQRRLERIEEIVAQRTRYLTIVLEDIYQSQNASAVLRTCECFGVQDVHIVENYNMYSVNPLVVQGADKWLTLHRHNQSDNNTVVAINRLKADGYRIIATLPGEESVDLYQFDVARGKFAVVFGNEHKGVSGCVRDLADESMSVPMCGFTQSLNISVSAAVVIAELTRKMKNEVEEWQMPEEEKISIKTEWLKRSVKNPHMLINRLLEESK